jgi:predicted CoA-binding protein
MPETCEVPFGNPPDEEIKQILLNNKVVAIVGLSAKPEQPSYQIAEYLQKHEYRIIPVNPTITEVLGEKAYPNLSYIPDKVDIVDIFRKAEAVPEIVDEAIKIGAKIIWMQEGIVNNDAADKARLSGVKVIMDKCMRKEHKKYLELSKNG